MSPLDSARGAVVVQKPKSDVYTAMLFVSLLAILLAILCLFLEMRRYDMDTKANDARLQAKAAVQPRMTYSDPQPVVWSVRRDAMTGA